MVHVSCKETCAIHAKALEEAHGLEAAFPGHALCGFTRLVLVEECSLPAFESDRSAWAPQATRADRGRMASTSRTCSSSTYTPHSSTRPQLPHALRSSSRISPEAPAARHHDQHRQAARR
eukprot:5305361-Pleurochrysis_carterae.AAC.1